MNVSRFELKDKYTNLVDAVGDGYTPASIDAVAEMTRCASLLEIRALDFYGMEMVIDDIGPKLPHFDDPSSSECVRELAILARRERPINNPDMRVVSLARAIAQSFVRNDVKLAIKEVDPASLFVIAALKNLYIRQEIKDPHDLKVMSVELALEDPTAAQAYVADGRLCSDALFGGSAYVLQGLLPDTDMQELAAGIEGWRDEINTPDFLRGLVKASGLAFADMHAAASVGALMEPSVEMIGQRVREVSNRTYPDMPKVGCPARHNVKVLSWGPNMLLSACEALITLEPKPSRRTNGRPPRRR